MKHKRDWAAIAAILALAVTMLAGAFEFYGRFVRLEQRMDESDVDRHAMMDTMQRIEQRIIDLSEAFAAGDPPKVKR